MFWAYHYIYWKLKGEDYDSFYGAYCKVGEEIRRFMPVILSDEEAPEILSASANTACRAFRYDGAVYLLVCNTSDAEVKGKVKVKGEVKETAEALEDLLDGIAVKIDDGIISFSLPPMGVAMIRMKESK